MSAYSELPYVDRFLDSFIVILPSAVLLTIVAFIIVRLIEGDNYKNHIKAYILFAAILSIISLVISPGVVALSETMKYNYGSFALGMIIPVFLLVQERHAILRRVAISTVSFIPSWGISYALVMLLGDYFFIHGNPLRAWINT